ncbi:hypothetical protein BV898_18277 [Hypsibius exemplaris]|uniref:Receptor ligand binding region domain-containing protein n=1 Tax=Hypsibius exemplaris TaxID=2072580 RepID=A0A9X6RNC0_HYPEX|nr:hypothetical protein BV898_18277 [Hypsibius exemplaris]
MRTAKWTLLVLFSILFAWTCKVTCLMQVDIACPGFVDPADGNRALAYHAPAYEAAVKQCNTIYAGVFHFTLTYLIEQSYVNVRDNSADRLAGWYYDQRRRTPGSVTAIVSPGNYDTTLVHQLTDHWSILCLATLGYQKSEYTSMTPTTTMISAAFVNSPVVTIMNLLTWHGWRNVFAVVDDESVPIYRGIMETLGRTKTNPPIRLLQRHIIASALASFTKLLTEFELESRVEAAGLNLTTGEFVFICYEPYPFPKSYGVLHWQRPGEVVDNEARVSNSVFIITQGADARLWTSNEPRSKEEVLELDAVRTRSTKMFHIGFEIYAHLQLARNASRSLLMVNPYDPTDSRTASNDVAKVAGTFRVRGKELYNINITADEQVRHFKSLADPNVLR